MRGKTIWLLVAAAGLLLALDPVWSFALQGEPADDPAMQGPPGMMGPRTGMAAPDPETEMGLSEEQLSQLRALRSEAAKAGLRARTDMQLKQMELEELLEAEEPDEAAIQSKLRELSDARHALMQQRIANRLAMRRVLTPEQRAKWKKMRRHFIRRGMMQRFGGQRGFGPRGWRQRGFGPGRGLGPGRGPGFGPGRFGPGSGGGPVVDVDPEEGPPLP
jgi:Spy/CpxP family protein refolding chaperone